MQKTAGVSDMLRSLTGQNAQQHIHGKLIEKAKEKLSTTELSVSEIAHELVFEPPRHSASCLKQKPGFHLWSSDIHLIDKPVIQAFSAQCWAHFFDQRPRAGQIPLIKKCRILPPQRTLNFTGINKHTRLVYNEDAAAPRL